MRALVLYFCAAALGAQTFGVGVKAGVPIARDMQTGWAQPECRRYTVGAMVTAALPWGLRLEFNALYKRAGYRTGGSGLFGDTWAERQRGNSWEFPIVARRRLWRGIYGGAGYAPRVIHGSGHQTWHDFAGGYPPSLRFNESDVPGYWETTHGVVAAGGFERRAGPVHIALEIRYTRWNRPAVERYGSRGFSVVANRNQVEFLLGIGFP